MSAITTHILDTACGKPAEGVAVQLWHQVGDQRSVIAEGRTNADGRVPDLVTKALVKGTYIMHFATADYFMRRQQAVFYPWVDVAFALADGEHYHIPLLLSPYGYSTYRGS